MKKIGILLLALFALTFLFLAFGLWVRQQMPVPIGALRDSEIYSFDYLGYANTFTDFRFIGYGRLRHPLWGWLMSPVTLWGQRMYGLGERLFWIYILLFFAVVMAASVMMLYWLLRRRLPLGKGESLAVTALFLSFAHVWLLAGMPETYGLSLLLSLVMLYWGCRSRERAAQNEIPVIGVRVAKDGIGQRIDDAGWGVLAVLMGGITITQSVKTLVAYCLVRRPSCRRLLVIFGAGASLGALVVGVFALRVWLRVRADAAAPGFAASWHTLVDNFPASALAPHEWLRCLWVFLSEPIILRGEPFDVRVIAGGYGSWLPVVLLAILYGLAAVSVVLNRNRLLVKVLLGLFSVDFGIHFVAQWGIQESHLYAGHWFFAIPLLIGMLFPRLKAAWRPRFAWGVVGLALAILVCNAYGYFGHDVGLVWPPVEGK